MRTDRTQIGRTPASRSASVKAREAGFALIARTNRLMIGGAVILAGGVSAVTAHAFHARAATTSPPKTSAASAGRSASRHHSDDSGGGLQPPSQAPSSVPAPAPAPAPAVSGGS